jgi:hypothetical protein
MEIKHAEIDGGVAVVQMLRAVCPKCREAVEFILCEEDRQYREDAEFYAKKCCFLREEVERLKKAIDRILANPPHRVANE